MGQIRKRGKYYQIRYYRNGQRIEESTKHTKYDDARDLLRDREAAISKGVPITAKSTRLTFDDAVKDVQHDYTVNAKKSSGELDRRIKLHLTPAFGGRRLSAITTADLRAFTARRLGAGASPSGDQPRVGDHPPGLPAGAGRRQVPRPHPEDPDAAGAERSGRIL